MICAVIVAGGSGARMKARVPKQYLVLKDRPILAHTLLAFDSYRALERIVLVVPKADVMDCRDRIVAPLKLAHELELVAGGRRRQDSVRNGLNALGGGAGIVMIHDGVRPFVRAALLDRLVAGVCETGACIPVVPATDTLKQIDAHGRVVGTLDRQRIRLAQTPQTFSTALIRRAHQDAASAGRGATDDAAIAEFAGVSVTVVPGDRDNIKITTPQDLDLARTILDRWHNPA